MGTNWPCMAWTPERRTYDGWDVERGPKEAGFSSGPLSSPLRNQ